MRKVSSVVLACSLLLLAGCNDKSGEPSADEMKAAVGANIKADVDRTLANQSARVRQSLPGFQGVSRFSKGSCQATEQPQAGWTCSFSMTFKLNNQEISKDHTGFFSRDAQGQLSFKP